MYDIGGRCYSSICPTMLACTESHASLLALTHRTQVHMPLDKETKKPLGFAYILYMIPENAVRALEELDGSIFQVRWMRLCADRTGL